MRRLDLNLLAGISLIPIEMPSAASPVNAYLVRDRPLTLVDTGPNLVPALEQLEQGLASHGYQIEDLERVVLTHPHIDHVGLAAIIRDRSGAEVCAAAGSERWLEHYRESELWTKGWREQLMLRHGVPAGVVSANAHGSVYRQSWDPSVAVDRSLADGELLEFEHRSWRIAARPGHSPFDLLLHDESGGHMLVGDHLIEHISSNPLITPIPGSDGASRPQALLQYRRSLAGGPSDLGGARRVGGMADHQRGPGPRRPTGPGRRTQGGVRCQRPVAATGRLTRIPKLGSFRADR
jgi:glyoxylase-like metal-dependent hydrolase (beta-lactamase superfamily II)